jgi:hypothetical protein
MAFILKTLISAEKGENWARARISFAHNSHDVTNNTDEEIKRVSLTCQEIATVSTDETQKKRSGTVRSYPTNVNC